MSGGSAAPRPDGGAGAWSWDVRAHILRGDGRFAELCGLDAIQASRGLLADAFFQAIHPDDAADIRKAVEAVVHGNIAFSSEYRLLRQDGGVRWVGASAETEIDADGRVMRLFGVLSDVTDRKRIEERLRVVQSAGGIGNFEYLSGAATVDVSPQFCLLLGLPPADTVALPLIDAALTPDSAPFIPPPDGDAGTDLPPRELRIVRRGSGDIRWIAQRGEVQRSGPDGATRLVGIIYDITDFRNAETRLRDLTSDLEERVEERTRERDRMWNNSRDLLAIVGRDGVIRAINPTWTSVLGYRPDDIVGRHYSSIVVPDGGLPPPAPLDSGPTRDFSRQFRHKDGGLRWISWHTATDGDLIYASGRDVTQERVRADALRRTEEQLRQSQKMEAIGQLTGGVAHDFNNMLTVIVGALNLIRRQIGRKRFDDIGRFMDAAEETAHRAGRLTHRLLAFARQQSLNPKDIDVVKLVRSLEELLTRTLGEQIVLSMRFAPDAWRATSDENQLENAIINLAINARDAMPRGGRLTVWAENAVLQEAEDEIEPGAYVVVGVSDTGQGMSPETASKAFEPFFTTKPHGHGTGLGLSTIYGFMRQTGGGVSLSSAPGQGTTVRLFLPRFIGSTAAGKAPSVAAAQGGAGETILVVEDEDAVRQMIVQALHDLGYRTLEAAGSDAALRIVRAGARFHLLVTDVGLPGLNGRQLADAVRALRPKLPVLFLTGYAASAADRTADLAPGMEMVDKPFTMAQFSAQVRRALGPRK
ncbi:MAG: PAS domain-containing protein [Proteobacteria bacterium]|nr:PAS domain-containing protein [Pseudomonadota bacterium]